MIVAVTESGAALFPPAQNKILALISSSLIEYESKLSEGSSVFSIRAIEFSKFPQ